MKASKVSVGPSTTLHPFPASLLVYGSLFLAYFIYNSMYFKCCITDGAKQGTGNIPDKSVDLVFPFALLVLWR